MFKYTYNLIVSLHSLKKILNVVDATSTHAQTDIQTNRHKQRHTDTQAHTPTHTKITIYSYTCNFITGMYTLLLRRIFFHPEYNCVYHIDTVNNYKRVYSCGYFPFSTITLPSCRWCILLKSSSGHHHVCFRQMSSHFFIYYN